jgi:hypothetical protein
MSITIIPLSEADHAGVCQLLVRCWGCDLSGELLESYFSWRYGNRGNGETLVACDKGRCVGILDSFVRPYWIAGRQELVRETCDWFCLPEYRAFGVGLRLMRRMMAKPEPMLVIGGTKFTMELLPRLKWARFLNVDRFMLPCSTRTAAGLAARHLWPRGAALARMIPDLRLVRQIRREPPPSADAHVRCEALEAAAEAAKIAPYDLAPVLDISILHWLASTPKLLGEMLVLSFFSADGPVGVSVSRLQMLPFGLKAQIVHVHAARLTLVEWILGETVHHLIGRGAGAILYDVSCPATGRALGALGFVRRRPMPVFWWPANKLPPTGVHNLSLLRADDAFEFA